MSQRRVLSRHLDVYLAVRVPRPVAEEPKLSGDVLAAIKANRKIEAIKLLRAKRNLGLKKAKDIVDNYIAKNPPSLADLSRQASVNITPLVLAAVATAVLYFAYKALS